MSLLLDALKKAAKDKEASSAVAADASAQPKSDAKAISATDETDFEFSLDDISTPAAEPEQSADSDNKAPASVEAPLALEAGPAPNTVSDEALQVLIYKTNHAHRRRRLIIWGSAATLSVIVLLVSGLYFFSNIQQEVETLEQRHRINMQAVQSEPVKTSILEFASEAGAREKIYSSEPVAVSDQPASAKEPAQTPAGKKTQVKNKKISPAMHASAARQQTASNQISVVLGEKADPVGALLARAWGAYNKSDYAQANNLYAQVLDREKNNRDALMGLGAIALKNNDDQAAMQYYNKLLQLDPRDPVANAAILNMNNSTVADAPGESKLLYLIQLNPDAAHLYYALGNRYSAQSKWPEAEAAYFSAFEHDSSSADYAYNLAVSLERTGRPKEAVKYYNFALQLADHSNISFSADVVAKRLELLQP
jgi:Flp pilus assembly protein TadD